MAMDPNRLHLNFATGGYNNDRSNYPASNENVYPTTPSTFPQPVFKNQPGKCPDYQSPTTVQSPTGYNGGGGYFANPPSFQAPSPYGQPQPQQPQYQAQYPQQPQQGLSSPQPSFQQRQGGYNTNDPTTGLAYQFSNQNLGSAQRQPNPYARQPSPNTRPRTGGANGQPNYGNLLSPPVPVSTSQSPSINAEEPPDRNPAKYSPNVGKRGQGLHVLVEAFFKENITRARDRNLRARELEEYIKDPMTPDHLRKQQSERMWRAEAQYLRFLRTKESPSNFITKKVIGKGAFGEVKLVQRKTDGKIYALKSLVKTEMFKKDQLAHVRAERDILAESDSPWVVKLHTTFQDPTYLYMLMEFLPGGDLMTMLIKYEIFSEDITRFYMAEIVLAIEAVHKLGYVHRGVLSAETHNFTLLIYYSDIKPDNILLDRGGHIKLTDFGLSTGFHAQHENSYYQQLLQGPSSTSRPRDRNSVSLDQINLTVTNRGQINTWRKSRRVMAYSTVGTPDYIAPEIFSGKGYSFSCDWWSVGAIMFECLIGWPPFCADDPHDTYKKIVDWPNTLNFPGDIPLSYEAESLIRELLCDAPQRLGTAGGQFGSVDIKEHPFFHRVVWDQLRTIRAPFEPRLTSNVDVSYFPTDEIDQSDHSALYRAQIDALGDEHVAEMNLPFIGYTYKRFDAFRGS